MPLKRTLCNPRFGCGGGGVHDSPTKPYRELKYTLSRLSSLVDARQGVYNSSSNSVLHEAVADTKAWSSSNDTHSSYRSGELDERPHLSSTRMLLHKVHAMLKRRSSTASLATVIVRPNMSIRSHTSPSLRHKHDVSDLHSLYTGSRISESSTICAKQVPMMSVDEEEGWETDDEGEEDEERRDV
ncbi:hypothetical protein LTR56_021833 [Elasticomyces elasticus]|nr:hypothetical protein LTR56_021833 [Elasticomyces elasticus]KAK3650842.1 hypothetical protein LTR22_012318 [Elasticomyces elasticus]KAK4907017.1 hypothetical protein LTR49_023938 [Elasticomyces elasticus]KAK5742414.1 hypothetical protein LTS12_024230 [Elasticomyces elasticus]